MTKTEFDVRPMSGNQAGFGKKTGLWMVVWRTYEMQGSILPDPDALWQPYPGAQNLSFDTAQDRRDELSREHQ